MFSNAVGGDMNSNVVIRKCPLLRSTETKVVQNN